jgi:hypothetical protein
MRRRESTIDSSDQPPPPYPKHRITMMIHTYTQLFLVPLMSEALFGLDDLYGLLIYLDAHLK